MNPQYSHEPELENLLRSLDNESNVLQKMIIIKRSYDNFPAKTIDDLIKIYKKTNFNEELKRVFVNEFIKNDSLIKLNCDNFITLMNEANFENNGYKYNLIQSFLEYANFDKIDCDDFIKIINGIGIADNRYKCLLFKDFLDSNKSEAVTRDDFIKIINGIEIADDYFKFLLFKHFLDSDKSETVTSDDIIKIINETQITLDKDKVLLVKHYLKHEKSSNLNLQDFTKIIKGVDLQNRADLSTDLYIIKFSASENYIENFIDFTKDLQPSEAMQCEFVKEFIADFIDREDESKNLGLGLRIFIEGLQDNELALDLIENLYYVEQISDEKDILKLVKNRSKKQYAFLTEIVGDKTLNDCISEEGIGTLKATFGDNLKVGDQPITVSDLISYYDLKGQTPSLSAMLKPEFKQQLRDNFAPSAEILLYKPAELEKLNSLLSEEGVIFDVKSYFVENAKLCDYLKEKVGPIDAIESGKTYQINFTNFGFDNSSEDRSQLEKQAEINTLFNKLLKSSDPNKEEVVRFFEDLLGITLSEFDEEKKDKLAVFFKDNKKELAHCFCNENLSKENFQSLFTTLQDGCFANIGTQFTSMLYGVMLKEEDDKVLYGVMSSKIISSIGNNQDINHGQDIGNDGRPLDNEIIKAYSLSPMALIEKLSKEEMLTKAKTWEIILKNLGDDHEIIERLDDISTRQKHEEKAKEIASYLIVKNVVGEEKMNDLESKNPQLKELGDFIYGRFPEASPGTKRAASELLESPSKLSR